jgi:hypothetical protein
VEGVSEWSHHKEFALQDWLFTLSQVNRAAKDALTRMDTPSIAQRHLGVPACSRHPRQQIRAVASCSSNCSSSSRQGGQLPGFPQRCFSRKFTAQRSELGNALPRQNSSIVFARQSRGSDWGSEGARLFLSCIYFRMACKVSITISVHMSSAG